MRFRSHIATMLRVVAVGIILAPRAADAELVQLTFSGTYDISSGSVFGESGSAVPFRYELTYDTDLGGAPFFIASGEDMGDGRLAAHEMYGYDFHDWSGVTASSFVFGTKTWDFHDDVSRSSLESPYPECSMWFDTDITVSTPGRMSLSISDNQGASFIGGVAYRPTMVELLSLTYIADMEGSDCFGTLTITSAVVPEPATFGLWMVAAAWFFAFPWRRRRSR